MTASKPATSRFSPERRGKTDFAKVDEHEITPQEYDELPELTDEFFARADLHQGGVLVKRGRGRPKLENAKQQLTMRLDPEVIEAMRASGPGWQVRVNDLLRMTFLAPITAAEEFKHVDQEILSKVMNAAVSIAAVTSEKASSAPAQQQYPWPTDQEETEEQHQHVRIWNY